ncbi:MAG: hypothetical protein HND57_15575 [Planctomycetes bacterium]|nr:hypothetical protein [Planctomycetota bacterium]
MPTVRPDRRPTAARASAPLLSCTRTLVMTACCLALGMSSLLAVGCKNKKEPTQIVQPEAAPNPLPAYLRGTIRYEAELLGYGPTLVQGYGLVVGLNGTGSRDTPIVIRTIIENEASKMRRDSRINSPNEINVQELLNSMDTAVVLVEATIPPGAPRETMFDVRVAALPSTSTTSLFGGRLWTARLTQGFAHATGPQSRAIALARGDVFINPFVNQPRAQRRFMGTANSDTSNRDNEDDTGLAQQPPDLVDDPTTTRPITATEEDEAATGLSQENTGGTDTGMLPDPMADVDQSEGGTVDIEPRVGRVLNGGIVLEDRGLVLVLRSPGHSRSRAITDAINTRFPMESGQRYATAMPIPQHADERISVTVPPSWSDNTGEFVELLMHAQISPSNMERRAMSLARWLRENPVDAPSLTWCLVALGPAAIPAVEGMYDYSELVPRLAALKTGALLGDPLAVPHLAEIATDPTNELRLNAVELLARMGRNVRISTLMRNLLNDSQRDIRLAAFDALRESGDPIVQRIPIGRFTDFELFIVPSIYPMAYVTQQQEPRIVIFGHDSEVTRPCLAKAWDDRLLVVGDMPGQGDEASGSADPTTRDSELRIFYRPLGGLEPRHSESSADLIEFIKILSGDTGPAGDGPGLGMSYAETIGVLYALHQQRALTAPLVLESDRMVEAIIRSRKTERPDERPITEETPEEAEGQQGADGGRFMGKEKPDDPTPPSTGTEPDDTDASERPITGIDDDDPGR